MQTIRTRTVALLITAMAVGLSAATTQAVPFVIDDFSTGSGGVSAASMGTDSDVDATATGAFGRSRTLTLPGTLAGDPISGVGNLNLNANAGGSSSSLDFVLDSLTSGSGMVGWSSSTPVDVEIGTNNAFEFEIISVTAGQISVHLFVTDEDGDMSSLGPSGLTFPTQQFPFSDFASNIDFDRLMEIALVIDGDDGGQLVIDDFTTNAEDGSTPPGDAIPEPATLGLLGLGGLAMLARRRKA